jgi:hypothetical protein
MKKTKNKYLRQLVRNYEIELRRPKGVKLIDLIYKQVPDALKNSVDFFVSPLVFSELEGMTKYKGRNIIKANVLPKSNVVAANPENIFYK